MIRPTAVAGEGASVPWVRAKTFAPDGHVGRAVAARALASVDRLGHRGEGEGAPVLGGKQGQVGGRDPQLGRHRPVAAGVRTVAARAIAGIGDLALGGGGEVGLRGSGGRCVDGVGEGSSPMRKKRSWRMSCPPIVRLRFG